MLREKRRGVSILTIALLAMGVVTLLFFLYRRENEHISVRSRSEFTIGKSDEIEYDIEEEGISSSGDYRIHGWFVIKGRVYEYLNGGMMEEGSGVYDNNHLCYVKNDIVYDCLLCCLICLIIETIEYWRNGSVNKEKIICIR